MEAVNKQKGMDGNVKTNVQPSKPVAGAEMPIEGGKMPFLKKWWFWAAIGAVIVIGVLVFFLL